MCLLAQVCAHAQSAPPPAAAASGAAAPRQGVSSLSTVVISGPRATGFTSAVVGVGAFRDQAPIDVPLTNSVVTRDVLDAQGSKSVMDAVRNTAGVTRSQLGAASYDNLAIRGVTMENRTSYRLNGSLPLIATVAIPMENKERVEVLKGASSMYYGMVPPAGIVSFETKRAGPRPVTSVATTVNEYGGYDVHLDVGRRFGEGDKFGLRANLLDGKDDVGLNNYHGRRRLASAAFDFRVTDSLTFKADFETYQKKSTEQAAINLIPTATVLPALPPNNRVNYGPENAAVLDARSTDALARIDWAVTENWNITADYGIVHATRNRAFPSFTFRPVTGTAGCNIASLSATGGSATNPVSYATGEGCVGGSYFPSQYYQNQNARIDLSGRIETGPVAHEATFGFTRNVRFQDGSTGGPANYAYLENYFNPAQPTTITPPRATTAVTSIQVDRGLYAVDRIIVSKQLHVMFGVRRTNYYSSNLLPVVTGAGTVSKTTPSASVIFKPTPNSSIYGSYLKGLEAGTAVQSSFLNGNQLLPAGTSKQIELGYKHQLGGLLVQGALFEIKKAFPTTLIDPNVCGAAFAAAKLANPLLTGFTVNGQQCAALQSLAGEQRFRGLEMAAGGDLNRNFGVVASALFMQPKITKDSTPAGSPNYQGKEPGNTSKQTVSLFGEYRPDALPGLGLNAGVYYTGRRAAHNSNNVYLPSFTLLSLGARYRTQLGSTAATFQLNVDNAANRNYWAAADATNAAPIVSTGLPRLIRATAKFDF